MKIKLTSGNRITIPKNIVNNLGLELNKYYEMIIENNKIIIDVSENSLDNISSDNIVNSSCIADKSNNIEKTGRIKIKSNLKESENFTRKVISECRIIGKNKASLFE